MKFGNLSGGARVVKLVGKILAQFRQYMGWNFSEVHFVCFVLGELTRARQHGLYRTNINDVRLLGLGAVRGISIEIPLGAVSVKEKGRVNKLQGSLDRSTQYFH